MQDACAFDTDQIRQFRNSLSQPRFSRYLAEANDDELQAINRYAWNSKVAQSLYIYLQTWEICLRNKVNSFLCWKYNNGWPYDNTRAVRNFKNDDKRRLDDTIQRLERDRQLSPLATSMIVADLSAGFWVSQLSSRYFIPYQLRYNLKKIFPNKVGLNEQTAWEICNRLLILRNRVAHHEPIFKMPLAQLYSELELIVEAMCAPSFLYAKASCTFQKVLGERPEP